MAPEPHFRLGSLQDWVKAGFLPLLDSSLTGVPPIPKWTNGICSLKEQPLQAPHSHIETLCAL